MHLANAQASLTTGVRELIDQPAGEATRDDLSQPISRAGAINRFDTMTADSRALFASIPADADMTRQVESERLGSLGIRGWLVIMAIHEADHLGQLKSLSS